MKKTIVASVLGMVASVAVVSSSYGQGLIKFDNYATTAGFVSYGASAVGVPGGGPLGGGVSNTFQAALYFAVGTVSEPADPSGFAVPQNLALLAAAGQSSPYFTPFDNGAGLGYFLGPALQIAGYASGPITFQVVAFNGADYASSAIRGHSAAFTMPSINSSPSPAGNFDGGLNNFQVFTGIPEPSTFALIGLGTGALLFFRRRK